MRRPRALIALALGLVALALVLAACGGSDDEETTTNPAPSEAPSGGAPPSLDAFPPEFVECLADQGIDVESIDSESVVDVIHSPEGNACFDALHQGGGVP